MEETIIITKQLDEHLTINEKRNIFFNCANDFMFFVKNFVFLEDEKRNTYQYIIKPDKEPILYLMANNCNIISNESYNNEVAIKILHKTLFTHNNTIYITDRSLLKSRKLLNIVRTIFSNLPDFLKLRQIDSDGRALLIDINPFDFKCGMTGSRCTILNKQYCIGGIRNCDLIINNFRDLVNKKKILNSRQLLNNMILTKFLKYEDTEEMQQYYESSCEFNEMLFKYNESELKDYICNNSNNGFISL